MLDDTSSVTTAVVQVNFRLDGERRVDGRGAGPQGTGPAGRGPRGLSSSAHGHG
jgi:hypothetical protein